jgi:hypothetical protein
MSYSGAKRGLIRHCNSFIASSAWTVAYFLFEVPASSLKSIGSCLPLVPCLLEQISALKFNSMTPYNIMSFYLLQINIFVSERH